MLAALIAVLIPAAFGQEKDIPGKKADPKTKYSRVKYDPAAETTVIGKLEEVQEFDCPVSNAMGSHFVLRTADSQLVVHVAPVSFMKQYGISFKLGDTLRIVGVRMLDSDGRGTMIAREISSNELLIFVRSPDGKPLW
jgi:hypothetical protein